MNDFMHKSKDKDLLASSAVGCVDLDCSQDFAQTAIN